MVPKYSWSVSRHDTFSSCRRKYFYSYYASAEDPEIYRLKKLSSLPLWAGTVVHETIETILGQRDTLPSKTEQEAMVRAAVHERMVADWRQSESGTEGFRLSEHEYDTPVEQEDKKLVVGTVKRSLGSFFSSPPLLEALDAGRGQWLSLEDLCSYDVGGVPVFLRMDLAFRNRDGQVVIVDWKTGRREGRFSETQVAGYAVYASEQGWAREPEQIRTELAYLAIPRYVRRAVDAKTLERARAFIQTSAASMKALLVDEEANKARIEDFPMVDRPRVCRWCNFRRLCFPR